MGEGFVVSSIRPELMAEGSRAIEVGVKKINYFQLLVISPLPSFPSVSAEDFE